MITLKQLEALRWIVLLGSFEKAAERLHTTQSAISKRIQELETVLDTAVFDRSQRGARLTVKGQAILAAGEEMLELRDKLVDVATGARVQIRQLRFGVTELTALTWLPDLVTAIKDALPEVRLEPEVEQSVDLFERLRNGTVDFIVVPDAFWHQDIRSVPLAVVQNGWMCSPTLFRERHMIPLAELARYSILTQGSRSGSGLIFDKWLRQSGTLIPHLISSNSLVALVGMTIAAIGVSYLPLRCFEGLINQGRLRIVETDPSLPPVTYVAMFRNDCPEALVDLVLGITRATCDFTHAISWA